MTLFSLLFPEFDVFLIGSLTVYAAIGSYLDYTVSSCLEYLVVV